MAIVYLDTSALVKLVAPEPETIALPSRMRSQSGKTSFSSQLARIELVRTVLRVAPDRLERAREVRWPWSSGSLPSPGACVSRARAAHS